LRLCKFSYLFTYLLASAVGPGNGHFISIRQVSPDAATLQREGSGGGMQLLLLRRRRC